MTKAKFIILGILLVFMSIPVGFLIAPLFVQKPDKDRAYEIIFHRGADIEERFISFDEPQIDGDVVKFNCAQNGCYFIKKYTADVSVHKVHLNKKLQVIGTKYNIDRDVIMAQPAGN